MRVDLQLAKFKTFNNLTSKNEGKKETAPTTDSIETVNSPNSKVLEKYYINFGAKTSKIPSRKQLLTENFTENSEKLFSDAQNIAKNYGHSEFNHLHVLKATLDGIENYIQALDSEIIPYDEGSSYTAPRIFEAVIDKAIFKDEDKRAIIKPIIEEQKKVIENILEDLPKNNTNKAPIANKYFVDDIYTLYSSTLIDEAGNELETPLNDGIIVNAVLNPTNDNLYNITKGVLNKLKAPMMLDTITTNKRINVSVYDEKAESIWKNMSLGKNIVLTYDEKSNPDFLVNSLLKIAAKGDFKSGKFTKENTNIINFTKELDEDFLLATIQNLKKEHSKNHVIFFNFDNLLLKTDGALTERLADLFLKPPKNLNILMTENESGYYKNITNPLVQKLLDSFVPIPIPIMSAQDTKKALKEEPLLLTNLTKSFSSKAIDKVVEAANPLEGTYPDKAIKLIRLIDNYYPDKKNIHDKDVLAYINEAKNLFKMNDGDNAISLIFDTGIATKDIVGSKTTQKEAQSIVRQIKDKSIGTKGYVIYSQDGSVGSGRKYTAKAIAGEAKIPYLEMNAMDFGTEDVNLFNEENPLSPEASIKKLFNIVKAQAEGNGSRAAVLFVENFEFFAVGEMVSKYHQKAMAQLLREMDSAAKQKLNIVVMGSVSDPKFIGSSTEKSFKFIDKLEIESPSRDMKARYDIINYYTNKKKLNVEDKEKTINYLSEITEGCSFIDIMTLLDKSKNVAKERRHKAITQSDFVEGYLQLTTGRASSREVKDFEKDVVTSHECGHALNLTVMRNLAKNESIPWNMPSKVGFITLDPRSWYGGAVYHFDTENGEHSFNKVFADMVCSLGGHSCEKKFFGMDGSWGITSDLGSLTQSASMAVMVMGQGHNFGKKSLNGMQVLSERDKNLMDKDINIMIKNAETISNLITDVYADFNREFTKKYAPKVGTGECLIHGDDFEKELAAWTSKQTPAKLAEINTLEKIIHDTIKASQEGKIY